MTPPRVIILIPFVLYLSILWQVNLTEPLKPASYWLQNQCTGWFTHSKAPQDLSASFICGKKVTNSKHKEWLQKSGIYHAIVVSGGHFLFLESVLKYFAIPYHWRLAALIFYYLMTGLQAPGLRCLVQMKLNSVGTTYEWKISRPALGLYAGLICLAVNSFLWSSLSFWLSFSVGMALSFSQELRTQSSYHRPFMLTLVCIYLFLIPFNFTGGYTHPLNLILGVILIYPFCLLLFTAAVFTLIGKIFSLNFLITFTNWLNESLFLFLKHWTLVIPDKNYGKIEIFLFWVYLFILIGALHFLVVHFRRETIRE